MKYIVNVKKKNKLIENYIHTAKLQFECAKLQIVCHTPGSQYIINLT